MKIEQTEQPALSITPEKFLAFVSEMLGGNRGREDDEHPLQPGPWDPVIRAALRKVFGPLPDPWVFGPFPEPWVFGPHPEPWDIFDGSQLRHGSNVGWKAALASILAKHPGIWDVIGGGRRGEEVGLNPQPLPPRYAFLSAVVQTVVSRAELMQEIADVAERAGTERGIIVVGGYTSQFADDWCGNGFKLRWPFPGPHPNWFPKELNGMDLVVMAAQFERAAKETFSPDLRQSLENTSKKLAEKGLSNAMR